MILVRWLGALLYAIAAAGLALIGYPEEQEDRRTLRERLEDLEALEEELHTEAEALVDAAEQDIYAIHDDIAGLYGTIHSLEKQIDVANGMKLAAQSFLPKRGY